MSFVRIPISWRTLIGTKNETNNVNIAVKEAKENDIFITQLENNIDAVIYGLKQAKEKNMITIFNPAPAKVLDNDIYNYIDYLILNEIEGKDLTNEEDDFKVLESLKEMYPTTHVLLTRGSKGVIYAYKDVMIEQPAYKVEAVDTTAAGDTFIGYFISGLVRQLEMTEILKLASKASSITVTRKGSSSSIPTLDEVQK